MTIERAINLLDNLIGMVEDNQENDYDTAFRMAVDALKQPEIVTCGECKHKNTHNCLLNLWATIFNSEPKDDFFCGMAERRTDADD